MTQLRGRCGYHGNHCSAVVCIAVSTHLQAVEMRGYAYRGTKLCILWRLVSRLWIKRLCMWGCETATIKFGA